MFQLEGKTALVTGASRGIGRNVALSLARAGATLELWGRDQAALAETQAAVANIGRKATISVLDVTHRPAVDRAVDEAIARGPIDILVINAGINTLKPFLDWTTAEWDGVMAVNLGGALHTLQAAGRRMVERKSGSVIVMASIYSFVGAPGNSIYCLTKGGVLQLARCVSVEWARYNVRVNSICPGWIQTDLTAPYMTDEKTVTAGLKGIPMHRFGQPEDIGPMAVYLAADESAWVTGQHFVIDGGQIAR